MLLCQTGVHCYFTGFITIFEKLNATLEPPGEGKKSRLLFQSSYKKPHCYAYLSHFLEYHRNQN